MKPRKIVMIPGDGIGPEICEATKNVLSAAGAKIDWVIRHAGVSALEKYGDVLPKETINAGVSVRSSIRLT